MKVLGAEFVTSAAAGGHADGIPRDAAAHIALAGRSNVGKSSLINALVRRRIARTSAAPGKTRLANVYRVTVEGGTGGPGRWNVYLVDLPGYGYARGGPESASELRTVAEAYLGQTPSAGERGVGPASRKASGRSDGDSRTLSPSPASGPDAVLLLVDARHPSLESDRAAVAWLTSLGIRVRVVATKIDKLSRADRARNLRQLEDLFGMAALPVSAESGEGLNELWQMIAKLARS